jgi:POT family proton-dependent oligopeptide transporter
MQNDNLPANNSTMLGHPTGLFILFFTEMWERFSYYGMRAILVLYMYQTAESGALGWTKTEALAVYGWYTMLVYVMSIPGGIFADKFVGQKKAVMIGGIILCFGHGILAVDAIWAFYTGLGLIILGVGALKPNISTMVGGLYKPGDERRDKGFTIFYIGINIGAFLASITVAIVADTYGWHYGFGLAGIGMLLGQIVYMAGQKHLVGVGDLIVEEKSKDIPKEPGMLSKMTKDAIATSLALASIVGGAAIMATSSIGYGLLTMFLGLGLSAGVVIYKELNKIEKDRVSVLMISFLIVIVFWGAFEQAGGLLNIYTDEKIDRNLMGWEVPAGVFQSVNAFFIMLFGTAVAWFWVMRRRRNKEVSSLFKMAIGTIIMGAGFLCMTAASVEAGAEPYGKAGMYWLIAAYLLHTIGELCASPVALSFITKLAPVKYASIMMGVYFACTGLGNKLASEIGEAAQTEPIKIELIADKAQVNQFMTTDDDKKLIDEDKNINIRCDIYAVGDSYAMVVPDSKMDATTLLKADKKTTKRLVALLKEEKTTAEKPYHATLKFEKDVEAQKVKKNKGDGKDYAGVVVIEEVQNKAEFNIFNFVFLLTLAFGLVIILFKKKLKALTHGAEDVIEDIE